MSIFERFFDLQTRRPLVLLLLGTLLADYGESVAIASPPEIAPSSRGCIPPGSLPPLPDIRADNTPKQLLAHIPEIDRIEIFDPVERRVIATLTGRASGEFLSPIPWFAETPEAQWIAVAQAIGRVSRWRTVLLIYPSDSSQPFLAHPLSNSVLRLQRKHPYIRGEVTSKWRDQETDVYVDEYHMWRLTDAFASVRPLSDFCPATIRMPDCAVEQARRANEPVQAPRIRPHNTAEQLIASRSRITRIKVWSAWHRGVVGELDETEVADLSEQLGQATCPRNEWAASPPAWDALLLVYTRGSELPFALHVMNHVSLRVSHSDEVDEDIFVEHDLLDILPRYLGPEDPFSHLRFEREREVQRRCHPNSDIGDDPWPHLPSARIEAADP